MFSADFIGETNRIPVSPAGDGVSSPLGPLAIAPAEGMLCLRPESIGLSGEFSLGRATLVEAAFYGSYHRCHFRPVAAPDMLLTAHLPQGEHPQPGAEVELFGRNPVVLAAETKAAA